MARTFLYIVAGLIVLTIAGAFAYRIWGQQLLTAAMVPSVAYVEPAPLAADAYDGPALWASRPDLPAAADPARWTPTGLVDPARRPAPLAAVFFVHPTSYINRAAWNGAIDDAEARTRADQFIRGQASAFNGVGAIWAPRYRQATFGAFLTGRPAAARATDAAYRDVAVAFAAFLRANPGGPVILAGHSQGSLHLMRLMRDRVAGTPLARRIVAAYLVGWPVSRTADLPALGLPACNSGADAGCVLSWQSFADPADTRALDTAYAATPGLDGTDRRGTPMLCTDPLGGGTNPGMLRMAPDGLTGALDAQGAPRARCTPQGHLLIDAAPDLGPFLLPGNNYHVYDYALFWLAIRRDAERRLAAWRAAR